MHEVGLVSSAVDIAVESATKAGALAITRIRMRIGSLSGVVPSALEFAFECVVRETMAEGATFEYEIVPVRCRCPVCKTEFRPETAVYRCPNCGEISTELISGRELQVVDIEVEQ